MDRIRILEVYIVKKTLLILSVLILAVGSLSAQSVTEDKEIKTLRAPSDGKAKLGLLLGYPSGITFGYQFSNWFEANATVGSNFSNSVMISANGLFTIVNIPIGDAGVMPLSLGPQLNFLIGNNFYLDIVADLRLAYTFPKIPLNLFAEVGFGVRLFDSNEWWSVNGGVGVRYVF